MKPLRTILITAAASLVVAAPAAAQNPNYPDSGEPKVFATVVYYDEAGTEQKTVECAWNTAPTTDECWTTVADGPDAVATIVKLGFARATWHTRHPLGEGRSTLRKRADGTWHFSGKGTSRPHPDVAPVERQWGFVSDTNGENWVRYEVNELASTARVIRGKTAKVAVAKASARLKRQLRSKQR
jgi:hypothetical protein